MEQGPEARQQRGVPDISLAALGAWQGAGLGAMGAFLYGCSVLVTMAGGQASRNLFAALIVTTLRITAVGVLPSALLGGTVGALAGHGLCRLPVGATVGHAAVLGTIVSRRAGAAWDLAPGGWAITLAGDIATNPYLFNLAIPVAWRCCSGCSARWCFSSRWRATSACCGARHLPTDRRQRRGLALTRTAVLLVRCQCPRTGASSEAAVRRRARSGPTSRDVNVPLLRHSCDTIAGRKNRLSATLQ